jgi:hypothetical protein
MEGGISAVRTAEDGSITFAVAGGTMPRDMVVATLELTLATSSTEFELQAEGSVNENPMLSLDAVNVVELPEEFALLGNYPNPFNPSTTIQVDLPADAQVSMEVYDVLGRRVMVLPVQAMRAGVKRSIQLDGSRLASGSYFYRVIAKMEQETAVDTGRMLLIK